LTGAVGGLKAAITTPQSNTQLGKRNTRKIAGKLPESAGGVWPWNQNSDSEVDHNTIIIPILVDDIAVASMNNLNQGHRINSSFERCSAAASWFKSCQWCYFDYYKSGKREKQSYL
jgi:hypothetical protein